MKRRVLVVDDEPKIARFIAANLQASDYWALTAASGSSALEQIEAYRPDLVLLDIMLPDTSGFDVLRNLRTFSDVPVIIVTAKGDPRDAVQGLELGADDYVAKPFNVEELLARVAAVFRRLRPEAAPETCRPYADGRLSLDPHSRRVLCDGELVNLTPTEFEVLYHLVSNHDRVLSHEYLLTRVWGPEYRDETHYLRVVIARLRQKLRDGANGTECLRTVPRVGYEFRASGETRPQRERRGVTA